MASERQIWDKACEAAAQEPTRVSAEKAREVLRYDPAAVRKTLHDAREARGVRVPKVLQKTLP